MCSQTMLCSFERERLRSRPSEDKSVEDEYVGMENVKRLIRYGEHMNAYPTCFNHAHLPTILQAIKRSHTYRKIIYTCLTSNGVVRYGVRIKIIPYCEQTMAVWVMIAAVYRDQDPR